jgi:hypothetical protein
MIGFFPDPYPDELLYSACASFVTDQTFRVWRMSGDDARYRVIKAETACNGKATITGLGNWV